MYANENAYDDAIGQWAARYNVPVFVVKATIGKESGFDARAFNPGDPGTGARGLMQMLESTARDLGLRGTIGDDGTRTGGLYEPGLSIQLGTKFLGQLRDRNAGATWDEVYSAYNVGHLERLADGRLVDQSNVDAWSAIADHFSPGWRTDGGAGGGANPTTRGRR